MRKIIDFHAHIFNPKIAHLAIANLEEHYGMPWECKGTFTDMKEEMDKSLFYRAVIFSTPTKPTQVVINNDFLFDLRDERFIVFGSVHPDFEDVKYEIQRIKNHGLSGFKFHPDFQRFNIANIVIATTTRKQGVCFVQKQNPVIFADFVHQICQLLFQLSAQGCVRH